MRFANPTALWLLLLIPPMVAFFVWVLYRKRKLLKRFAQTEMLAKISSGVSRPLQIFKMVLFIAATFFLILSLARPQFGTKLEMVKRKGLDIAIAIDVSPSMLAEDIAPSRMQKARLEISRFIGKLSGDRVALIPFAGEAFLQCPLTSDYGAAKLFLESINPDIIPVPGTGIGDALEKAIEAFDARDRRYRVLLLLTDGEDHSGKAEKMAEEAAKQGIKIYCVGIGSPQGVPIPIKDENGNVSYKTDKYGNVVTTRVDEELLRKIALVSGGKYYHAQPGSFELQAVLDAINTMEKREMESEQLTQYEDRFQIPLLIAILLLVLENLLPDRRKRNLIWKGRFA